MLGYLGNARETKKAIAGELLRTGDVGYTRGEEVFLARAIERSGSISTARSTIPAISKRRYWESRG